MSDLIYKKCPHCHKQMSLHPPLESGTSIGACNHCGERVVVDVIPNDPTIILSRVEKCKGGKKK